MNGGFETATLESQVEHSTTEPKPILQNPSPVSLLVDGDPDCFPLALVHSSDYCCTRLAAIVYQSIDGSELKNSHQVTG